MFIHMAKRGERLAQEHNLGAVVQINGPADAALLVQRDELTFYFFRMRDFRRWLREQITHELPLPPEHKG